MKDIFIDRFITSGSTRFTVSTSPVPVGVEIRAVQFSQAKPSFIIPAIDKSSYWRENATDAQKVYLYETSQYILGELQSILPKESRYAFRMRDGQIHVRAANGTTLGKIYNDFFYACVKIQAALEAPDMNPNERGR